jgi:hypothetical protein
MSDELLALVGKTLVTGGSFQRVPLRVIRAKDQGTVPIVGAGDAI